MPDKPYYDPPTENEEHMGPEKPPIPEKEERESAMKEDPSPVHPDSASRSIEDTIYTLFISMKQGDDMPEKPAHKDVINNFIEYYEA